MGKEIFERCTISMLRSDPNLHTLRSGTVSSTDTTTTTVRRAKVNHLYTESVSMTFGLLVYP